MDKNELLLLVDRFIKQYNYRISRYDFDEQFFGDFQIILINSKWFDIRFISDKGQVFCDIKGKLHDWIDLNLLMKVTNNKFKYNPNLEAVDNIKIIIDFLSLNMAYISDILSLKNRIELTKMVKFEENHFTDY